ncbi:MAG TPA: RDD family protein, partial [Dehalococcoidia bacterium]
MQSQAVTRDTVSVGFGERFVAILIDFILVAVIGVVIRVVFSSGVAGLVSFIVGIGYYVYFWTSTGQTVGHMAMGLKVVKAEGGDLLDFGGALIRYIGYIVSAIPIFLGFFWVLFDS